MTTNDSERQAALRMKQRDKERFRFKRFWFAVAALALIPIAVVLGIAGLAIECLIVVLACVVCGFQSWDAHEIIQGVKRRPDRLLWTTRGNDSGPGSRAAKSPNQPIPESPPTTSQRQH